MCIIFNQHVYYIMLDIITCAFILCIKLTLMSVVKGNPVTRVSSLLVARLNLSNLLKIESGK